MKQVRLVEEKDGVDSLLGQVLDERGNGIENTRSRGRGLQAQGEAELTVEVATTQRGIVAVGEAKTGRGDAVTQRAQDTRAAPTTGFLLAHLRLLLTPYHGANWSHVPSEALQRRRPH